MTLCDQNDLARTCNFVQRTITSENRHKRCSLL